MRRPQIVSLGEHDRSLPQQADVAAIASGDAWLLVSVHPIGGARFIHPLAHQIFAIECLPLREAEAHQRRWQVIQTVQPADHQVNLRQFLCAPPLAPGELLPAHILQLTIDCRRFAVEPQPALTCIRGERSSGTVMHVPQVFCPEALQLSDELDLRRPLPARMGAHRPRSF